jgi:hypothetical protein
MRSRRRTHRSVRVVTAAAGLTALVTLMPLAPATAAGSLGNRSTGQETVTNAAASPVGAYEIHSSNGGSGDLLLSTDGTFSTDYGDSGIWVSQGTAVAMRVNTVDGDEGCLYLGTFTKRAINSAHAQGPTNCGGSQDTWYAVGLTKKKTHATVRLSASSTPVPTDTARKKTEEPAPDYLVTWDSSTFSLTVSTDGLLEFQQTGPITPVYDGFWVVRGKVFAYSVVLNEFPPYDPCLFLGTFSSTGVGSPTTPGASVCTLSSTPKPWYATLPT